MLVPATITRSGLILKVKGDKTLTSVSFIADFGGGNTKVLNSKTWSLTSLLKPCEYGIKNPVEVIVSVDECPLYYRDWTNVPILGNFKKDYPTIPCYEK